MLLDSSSNLINEVNLDFETDYIVASSSSKDSLFLYLLLKSGDVIILRLEENILVRFATLAGISASSCSIYSQSRNPRSIEFSIVNEAIQETIEKDEISKKRPRLSTGRVTLLKKTESTPNPKKAKESFFGEVDLYQDEPVFEPAQEVEYIEDEEEQVVEEQIERERIHFQTIYESLDSADTDSRDFLIVVQTNGDLLVYSILI